jgi:hypothetical protein
MKVINQRARYMSIPKVRERYREHWRKYSKKRDKKKESERVSAYRKTEKGKAYMKMYRAKPECKQKRYVWQKNYRMSNNSYLSCLKYQLKRYKLDMASYNILVKKQNGLCAICGKNPEKTRLSVDHNHTTGEVRGLLCRQCNTGIGLFNDKIELLSKAVEYLKNGYQS